jgi:large subunit ribosomal protein L4
MKIDFYKLNGEKDTPVEYPKELESEASGANILEYVRMVLANKRQVSANTKDRSEVSGGGKKPWRQKGTGRARVGSSRSPIWSGGGVTFGPRSDKNYNIKLNKKEKRAALLTAIYSKVKDKSAVGMTGLKFTEPKTKIAASAITSLPLKGKVVVFLPASDDLAKKSFANMPFVTVSEAKNIDIVSLVSADNIIFTKESLIELGKHFPVKKDKPEPVAEKEAKNE